MYTYLCQSIFRLQTVLQSRNVQIDHVFYISTAIDIELKQDNSTINNNNSAVKICTDSGVFLIFYIVSNSNIIYHFFNYYG